MRVSLRLTGPFGFAQGRQPRRLSPHGLTPLVQSLREFQSYEFGWFGARVGYGVGIVGGEPSGVARFEVGGHGAVDISWDIALDGTVDVEIAHRY